MDPNLSRDQQALLKEVNGGSLKRVVDLAAGGLNKDETWFDYKLLISALQRGHKGIINFLLKNNCRVKKVTEANSYTAMHYAVELGDANIVKQLLKKNASIYDKGPNQETPYDLAMRTHKYDVVEAMLLSYDFKHATPTNNDNLAHFHYACKLDYLPAIQQFVSHGFPVNGCAASNTDEEHRGFTPLHFAVKNKSRMTIVYLLKQGAHLSEKNAVNWTPLHLAYHTNKTNIFVESILQNLDDDQHVNSEDETGLTHLHICCTLNMPSNVESFLENGADVNCTVSMDSDKDPGYTPLHFAVENKREKIVELLLKHHANATIKSKEGLTPLHLACKQSNLNIVKLLLESRKADVNAKDLQGKTPLMHTCEISERPIHQDENSLEIVCTLLHHNADIHTRFKNGESILHVISRERKLKHGVELAKLFLSKGADVQAVDQNYTTPLHLALSGRRKRLVELFLDNNANINAKDKSLATPLHVAVDHEKENEPIVDLLLANGCYVNAQNSTGETPLHLAIFRQNLYVTQQLLQHGADINRENYANLPPVSKLLLENGNLNVKSVRVVSLLLCHLNKMTILGLHVTENVKNHLMEKHKISEAGLNEIGLLVSATYTDELERLKRSKIDGYSTDLHSILWKDAVEMSRLVKNESLKSALADDYLEAVFPVYGYMLKLQLRRGLERAAALEPAKDSLEFLTGLDLPATCTDHIFGYLDEENVDSLIQANSVVIPGKKRSLHVDLAMDDEPPAKQQRLS